jgi:predicted  nucleic acid-binding Zn-ribbon protein
LRESEEALAHSNSALTELWTNVTAQAAEINRLTEVQGATQKTVDALLTERETLQSYLGMERQTVATLREQLLGQAMQLHAIEQEVGEVRTHLGERDAELTATQSVLGEREKRVESLEQLLQTSRRDHTKAIEEMTHSQRRIQKLTERLSDRTRQAADLKSELAVYAESLAAIRRTLAQTNQEALGEMMGYLRILEPIEHEGPTIALERAITTIGRTQDNDVCVPLNVVSRHHARLLATPNGVIIEDAGSKNGCFVNGRQIHHQLMRDGDVLALGNLRFRLSKLRAAGGRMQNVAAAALPAAN